jgi:hypothetical protein
MMMGYYGLWSIAFNVCANYATPHSTLFMIECGVERTLLSSLQLALTEPYQMCERRSLSLLAAVGA